jgi:hypothetical protein
MKRILFLVVVLAMLVALVIPVAAPAMADTTSSATITTDKTKYSCGEPMVISGSGFTPGDTVNIEVNLPGNNGIDTLPAITADDTGSFLTMYNPPYIPGRYKIVATDGSNAANTAATEADSIGYNKGVYNKDAATEAPTGHWTTGNAGKWYKENQWVYYQYEITGIPGSDVPTFNVVFNFWQSNTNAIFIDAFSDFRYAWNTPMLADDVPYPGTTTTTWHTWMPNKVNWDYDETTHTLSYPVANTPVQYHGFAVDDPAAMFATGAPTSGTNTLVIFFRAHLTLSTIWMAGQEGSLGSLIPVPTNAVPSGAAGIFGEEVFAGWDAPFYGVGFATGSSRHFNIQDQSAGSSGAITLPIPTVGANYIIIKKVTIPSPAVGVFGYTGVSVPAGSLDTSFQLDTDPATTSIYDMIQFSDLATGKGGNAIDYVFTEGTIPAGWELTSIACEDILGTNTFTYDLANKKVTVRLDPDGGAICTFTNTETASLAIQKQTVGGTASFDYTVSGSGLSAFSRNTATQGNPTTQPAFVFNGTQFGDKYVKETALAGWTLTGISCTANGATIVIGRLTTPGDFGTFVNGGSDGYDQGDDVVKVTVAAGNTPTCTFTNTKNASLAIQKYTVGGTASFDYTVNGSGLSAFNRDTSVNNPTTAAAFPFDGTQLGIKYVKETALAGWTLTGISCTANGATIVIGRLTTPGDFGTFVNGGSDGYDQGDDVVKVTVAAGNTPTCTFTNTKNASLAIQKYTVGGTATFAYTVTGNGMDTPASPFDMTTVGDASGGTDSLTFSNLVPGAAGGARSLAEGANPSGFAFTDFSCALTVNGGTGTADFDTSSSTSTTANIRNIGAGDTITCTFNNAGVGGTRTQGFWATHVQFAWVVWHGGTWNGTVYPGINPAYNPIGTHTICNNAELMGAFWSNVAKQSDNSKRSKLDQARMQLLQQLVAAILNNAAFGSAPTTVTIPQAITAFMTGVDVKEAASAMASFNEMYDGGEFATWQGAADGGKYGQNTAKGDSCIVGETGISFWDVLP